MDKPSHEDGVLDIVVTINDSSGSELQMWIGRSRDEKGQRGSALF